MHYYYTISALPDLPDYGKSLHPEEFTDAVDHIERNLEPKDRQLFRYLKYPNDHSNIIAAIISECHNLELPHNGMSVYPRDLIIHFRKHKDRLPDYMRSFISTHEERLNEYSIQTLEENLHQAFMAEVETLGNEFIKSFFRYDNQLRSIAALVNARVFETKPHSEIINPRLAQALTKQGGSSLLYEFPFLDDLSEALKSKHPDKIIEEMDKIRWNYINDQIATCPFTFEHVMGYYLKLMIIKRRSDLEDADSGKTINDILDQALENAMTT